MLLDADRVNLPSWILEADASGLVFGKTDGDDELEYGPELGSPRCPCGAPRCAGLRCLTALAQLLPGLGTPKAQPGCLLTWPARASVALALAASAAAQLSSPPWTPILKLRKNLENQRHRKARPRSAENRQVIWVQAAEQCWCHVQLRLNTNDTASSLLVEADGSGVARAAREQLGSEFGAQWQRAA
jgi:hypothetical protein